MHQENKFTQQITVLELLIQAYTDTMNQAINRTQEIENLLYIRNRLSLNEYLETR